MSAFADAIGGKADMPLPHSHMSAFDPKRTLGTMRHKRKSPVTFAREPGRRYRNASHSYHDA